MRNRSSMIYLEILVFGHSVRGAWSWNKCSNGTCQSPGKRVMLGSFSTASGLRKSLPTSSNSVGTHYVGSLRNLGFWLCRKNTVFFRKSRPWRQDSLLQWYSQPGKPKSHLKKSFGPWKKGCGGVPLLPGAHSPQEKGAYAPRELDTFILGIVRYQVGCSARFNDLQHTAPSTLKHTTTTLEFSAWQTKTVSAARIRKHPVPLICPKYSFTGHAWWQPLLTMWTRLSKHPSFEESDYLIPTISKDGMGFIARPGQADRTLRWLKDALGRRGVPPELFQDLTWHSFRVFIPDCAFQLGISRDQRRYLGNWMTESTADVYTREKRNVVVKVWHEVANDLSEISMGGRMEDLSHPDWEGLPLAEPSPSKKSVKDSLFSEPLDDDFTVVSPPKDQPPPLLEEAGLLWLPLWTFHSFKHFFRGHRAAIDEGDKIRTIYDGSWGGANAHIQAHTEERTTAPTVMDCLHGIHWLQASQKEPGHKKLPYAHWDWPKQDDPVDASEGS